MEQKEYITSEGSDSNYTYESNDYALGKINDETFMDDLWEDTSDRPVDKIFAHNYSKTDWEVIVKDYLRKNLTDAEMETLDDDGEDGIEKYIKKVGTKKSVNTRDLRPTQPWIGESLSIANHYDPSKANIAVIHVKDTKKYYIANGHHRAIAAILNGYKSINAYVVDVNLKKLK